MWLIQLLLAPLAYIDLFINTVLWRLCLSVDTCVSWQVCGCGGQTKLSGGFLPQTGVLGSGDQTWVVRLAWQVLLPAKPSCHPCRLFSLIPTFPLGVYRFTELETLGCFSVLLCSSLHPGLRLPFSSFVCTILLRIGCNTDLVGMNCLKCLYFYFVLKR